MLQSDVKSVESCAMTSTWYSVLLQFMHAFSHVYVMNLFMYSLRSDSVLITHKGILNISHCIECDMCNQTEVQLAPESRFQNCPNCWALFPVRMFKLSNCDVSYSGAASADRCHD